MVDFAKRWRTWLDWAGLREREPDERVRLPSGRQGRLRHDCGALIRIAFPQHLASF
jgi:hypothetical protein